MTAWPRQSILSGASTSSHQIIIFIKSSLINWETITSAAHTMIIATRQRPDFILCCFFWGRYFAQNVECRGLVRRTQRANMLSTPCPICRLYSTNNSITSITPKICWAVARLWPGLRFRPWVEPTVGQQPGCYVLSSHIGEETVLS